MNINRIRIQDQNPLASTTTAFELPAIDLELNPLAGSNGYFVKAIDGLGPPRFLKAVEGFDAQANPVFTNYANDRVISLKVRLKPGLVQSYGSLRQQLYNYLSRTVIISFMRGSIELARTYGSITNFDVNLFTNQPDIDVVITCTMPELVAPSMDVIPSAILTSTGLSLAYTNGNAPTGIWLSGTVTANHSNLTITTRSQFIEDASTVNPRAMNFTVTYNFLVGDQLLIYTDSKEKRIQLTRSSVTSDLVGYLNAGAVWPKLLPGVNRLDWDLASSWVTLQGKYFARFWGV